MSNTSYNDDIDQLVAYLDGELDDAARRAVERRLSDDAAFRERLARLERTWEMLDRLPVAEVDPSFAQTTVQMVAVTAADEVEQARRRHTRNQWLSAIVCWLVVLLAAWAGYAAIATLAGQEDRRLVADLPIIEYLDEFQHGESIAWLRALDERGLFNDDVADGWAGESVSETTAAKPTPAGAPLVVELLEERRARIEAMTPAELAALQNKRARFERLDAARQQELRGLYAALEADERGEALFEIMLRYSEWLRTLSPGQRAELLESSGAERIEQIVALRRDQERQRFRDMVARRLAPEDMDGLLTWLNEYIDRHAEAILAEASSEFRERIAAVRDERLKRQMLMFAHFDRRGRGQEPVAIEREEIGFLMANLSPDARSLLESVIDDPQRRSLLVQNWLRAAAASRFHPPEVSDQELAEFFLQLPSERKEQLQQLPPERMQRELRRLYSFQNARRFGDWGRPGGGPRGRGRGGFGGPDGPPPGGPPPFDAPAGEPGEDREFGPPPRGPRGNGGPGPRDNDNPRDERNGPGPRTPRGFDFPPRETPAPPPDESSARED